MFVLLALVAANLLQESQQQNLATSIASKYINFLFNQINTVKQHSKFPKPTFFTFHFQIVLTNQGRRDVEKLQPKLSVTTLNLRLTQGFGTLVKNHVDSAVRI